MPVQLNQQGNAILFPLTSPLEQVTLELGAEWVASKLSYGDQQIVVTVPFPDTIHLTGDVFNDDLLVPDHSGKSAFKVYQEIDQNILAFLATYPANQTEGIKADKLTKYEVNVILSDEKGHLAWAALKRRKGTDYGIWTFTLQFSPFKLGSERLPALIERLEDAFCMLDVVKLISRMRASRCDLAIDIYGLKPFDLVLSQNRAGKACVWETQNDHELVYLYAPKPFPSEKPKHGSYKAHGRMLARIYDRSAHAKWHKLPEPAGGIPVTRFEVSRLWKKGRPLLSELGAVKNMLAGLGAGFAWPANLRNNQRWRRIHRTRFPVRSGWCEHGPPIHEGIKLNRLYDAFPSDLVSPAAWSRWGDGLTLTGLKSLT